MKKMNFLGMPVNILEQQDIDEAEEQERHHHYMVLRCVDTDPQAGSPALRARRRRTPCEICQEICWIDPVGYEPVAHLSHTIICMACLVAKANKEGGADG